ncbi:hypothetical protein [Maricaulis sp.]|uniref:hypothetical protein n=1 Tax=Maricaulis sp. TaxID=1486257 RepID=UPI002B26D37F|nr:hypothetical protein [Maricaulis sp.]
MITLIAILLITPPLTDSAPASLSVSRSEIASRLSSAEQASIELTRLRQLSWQACRPHNRHGAMAEAGTRRCAHALLDEIVKQLDLPCLDAAHQDLPLSRRGASCDNPVRTARIESQATHDRTRDH